MVSQLTSLNFLNCLFFDKILLTFSYFSPKIFFNLSWPQTACSLNIFVCSPARLASYCYVMTALAVVSGHLPRGLCSSTFFPSFSPAAFSCLWIYHTLFFFGHLLPSIFLYLYGLFLVLHSQTCSCPAWVGCLTLNVPGLLQDDTSSHGLCTDTILDAVTCVFWWIPLGSAL